MDSFNTADWTADSGDGPLAVSLDRVLPARPQQKPAQTKRSPRLEHLICFAEGSPILTSHGERAVETLCTGDLVLTRDHELRPIRWIGHRRVKATGGLAPIEITSPVSEGRDALFVSPRHRILFTGFQAELLFGEREVLVAAEHMVDDRHTKVRKMEAVTYYHLMFDRHEIIYSQGLATESFDGGTMALSALDDAAREKLFAAFPDLRCMDGQHRHTARRCLKRYEARLLMDALRRDQRD